MTAKGWLAGAPQPYIGECAPDRFLPVFGAAVGQALLDRRYNAGKASSGFRRQRCDGASRMYVAPREAKLAWRHGLVDCFVCGTVGLGRVELPTSRLSGVRSNHLSYRPWKEGRKLAVRGS